MTGILVRGAVVAVMASVLLLPQTAGACSIAGPEPFDELLASGGSDSRPVVGFYEQEHVAWIPGLLFFTTERSASVVTRYWGEPPNLSVTGHGGDGALIELLGGGGCGNTAEERGHKSIHVTHEGSAQYLRSGYSTVDLADDGYPERLSADEAAALVERYGPAVLVSLGPDDYIVGYALVLWRPVVGMVAFGGLGYGVLSRIRKLRGGPSPRANPAVLAATVAGVSAIPLAVDGYGSPHWMGLLVGAAVSGGLGYLLRSGWALLGPAVLGWAIANGTIVGGSSHPDARIQTGIALLILGAGSLIWAQGHWSRWPAAVAVVSGAFVFTFGGLEDRGFTETPKLWAASAFVAAAAVAVIWGTVFRRHDDDQPS